MRQLWCKDGNEVEDIASMDDEPMEDSNEDSILRSAAPSLIPFDTKIPRFPHPEFKSWADDEREASVSPPPMTTSPPLMAPSPKFEGSPI